jgi:hypothetical protein
MDPIPSYNGYFITPQGGIFSERRGKIRERKIQINSGGYSFIRLRYGSGYDQLLLSRLLATTYIPNPKNLPLVRHLDDDPTNNTLSNLAWGTYDDNFKDSLKNGGRENCSKFNRDLARELLKTKSPKEVANLLSVSIQSIYKMPKLKHHHAN